MTAPGTIHASAALVGARGVLIRGDAGSGKSSLLLSLVFGASGASLVADDRVVLSVVDERLHASAPVEIAGLIEVRGLGIVRLSWVSPAAIDLVVDLLPLAQCPRLPDDNERQVIVEGIALPRIFIAVGSSDGAHRIHAALAAVDG